MRLLKSVYVHLLSKTLLSKTNFLLIFHFAVIAYQKHNVDASLPKRLYTREKNALFIVRFNLLKD